MGSLLIGNVQGSVERILFIDWFVALGLLAQVPVTWDGIDIYVVYDLCLYNLHSGKLCSELTGSGNLLPHV
jgi:hypothetical protein